jgi:uncharacterized membrane protein (DUF2068 family)
VALAVISAQGVWAVTDAYGAIEVSVDRDLAFGEAVTPLARWYLEFEVSELDAVVVAHHSGVVKGKDPV